MKTVGVQRSRQEIAFELLFRKHYVSLCAFASKFTANQAESEEIVQEVFINIWDKRDQLDLESGMKPYLFKSIHNMCLNFLRHKKIVDNYYAVIELVYQNQSESFDTYESLLYSELQKRVDNAIASLPFQCRKIFQMSRQEGLKYTEIAEKLEISVKTVETQMTRALNKLKLELKDYLIVLLISLFMS